MKFLLTILFILVGFTSWVTGWNMGSDDGMATGKNVATWQIQRALQEELKESECFTLAPIQNITFCPAGKINDKFIVRYGGAGADTWKH